jgi:hypothetical protein
VRRALLPLLVLAACAEGETPRIGDAAVTAVQQEVEARVGAPVAGATIDCPEADAVERLADEAVRCEWTLGEQEAAQFVVRVGEPPDLVLTASSSVVFLETAEVEQTVRTTLDGAGLERTRFDCSADVVIVARPRETFECTAVAPVVGSTTLPEAGNAAEVVGVITVTVLDDSGAISVRV